MEVCKWCLGTARQSTEDLDICLDNAISLLRFTPAARLNTVVY